MDVSTVPGVDTDVVRRRAPRGVDVARAAGVSQKTVSRVLNGEPNVSADVRQRVLQATRDLGYRPNGAARALLTGRTRRIGVVALGSALYGPASLLTGIEREARRAGYALSVVNTEEGDRAGIGGALEDLLAQGVDALVVSEPVDEGPVEVSVDVPVLVLGILPGLRASTVIEPEGIADQAGYELTRHLLALGHDTVHHIAGPLRWFQARDRLAGWRRALAEFGASVPDYVEGDWTPSGGYRAAEELAHLPEMTAIFVANDDMAIGAMSALTKAGLRVPDDVSVVGIDDVPLAAYVYPPLTTMALPFDEIARAGLVALIHAIEDPHDTEAMHVRVPIRLVRRASTAAPRRGRTDPHDEET